MRMAAPGAAVLALAAASVCLSVAAAVATGPTVTIYRDSYGVPHVYGDSEAAAAFGVGYAQAEDRLDALLLNYLKAEGHAARALGAKGFDRDVEQRMYRYAEVAQRRFSGLSSEVRADLTHFVAGVRQYMKEHPAEVPAWAPDPQPWHPVALSRLIAMPWPLGQAREDLWRAPPEEGRGSNAWAVCRGRSAEGCPILLIDPHLPWNDENLFYEVHLHGGDLHAYGHTFAGLPYPIVGHNDRIAWAFTTGGPDCADVYEEETDPSNPLRYRYDGAWRDVAVETVEAEARTERGAEVWRKEVHRTHHGPVVDRRGNRAYAVKTAYDEEAGFLDGVRRILLAKGLADFRAALGALFMVPQNVLYADVEDNLYYAHVGRVPVRPGGFAWDRPVPGQTSATEWKGFHPLEDLVSCLNPPVGFLQNCNVSPGAMFPESPMTPDRYLPYLYNDRGDRTNARGSRVVDILLADAQVELEAAQRIAVDTYVRDAEAWQQALVEAYRDRRQEYGHLGEAVEILQAWDRQADADSPGMTLYRFWRRALRSSVTLPEDQMRAIQQGRSVQGPTQTALLAALDQTVRQVQRTYGGVEVAWGDVFRLKRGDRTWPLSGAGGEGVGVLRSVSGGDPDRHGVITANRGQSCTTLVLLGDPVQSFSAVPWGQSNRPDSPHFADQADRLFSRGQFKPTWYAKEALMENLESKRTLAVEMNDER